MPGSTYIGACSWNYDSWVGLVYSRARGTAVEYLREYAGKYRSAEIDSWFYKIPSEAEVREYGAAVDEDFRFVCKAPQDLTLVLTRGKAPSRNPSFLSAELFGKFYERIAPLGARIGAIILEFEYLNRQKISGVGEFIDRLGSFVEAIPRGMPIAAVYDEFRDSLGDASILRLLGDDRKEIEAKAGDRWDRIIDEKPGKGEIVKMVRNLMIQGKTVYIDVNNHYEGSAPLTIESIRGMLEEREAP